MSITAERKQQIMHAFANSEGDTGSVEVQCAILTERINNLTQHMRTHGKDYHSRRGLLMLVGRRKSLIAYIKKNDHARYEKLIQRLQLRK